MKVMLDTNVLISAMLFPRSAINATMADLLTRHEIYLSSYVVDELSDVVLRKFPTKIKAVDKFLLKLNYTFVETPEKNEESLFKIRDLKDYPVLYTAMLADMDLLITGDADFDGLGVNRPEILTLAEYRKKYQQ